MTYVVNRCPLCVKPVTLFADRISICDACMPLYNSLPPAERCRVAIAASDQLMRAQEVIAMREMAAAMGTAAREQLQANRAISRLFEMLLRRFPDDPTGMEDKPEPPPPPPRPRF